ncbi:MAG: VCBS repeat-containing protein [Candidatus Brocadiia bacterium]
MKMKIFYAALLVISASMLFADGFAFQPGQIDVNGPVDNIIVQDINNDSRPELIIQNKRQLLVYKPSEAAGYALANTVILPDNIFIYDISGAIFGVTPEGLVKSGFGDLGKFTPELSAPTIFRGKPNDKPIYRKFIYPELGAFIPCENRFSLARLIDNQYKIAANIPYLMRTSVNYNEQSVFEPVTTRTSLPRLIIADINGDGNNDVLALTTSDIRCFINDGRWVSSSVLQAKAADSNEINIIAPVIEDINNDKKADIVTADSSEGVITVYLAPEFGKPAQIIRTGNWIVSDSLIDLNNDGLRDLVLVQMKKLGVLGGLQAFLAHSVDWEMVVYLARPGSGFPKSPDYVREFNVPFTLNISGSGNISGSKAINYTFQTPYLWSFSGDFNKDGLKDLLISTADGKLQIYPGVAGRVFEREPAQEILLASIKDGFKLTGMPQGEPIVNDLNNDGVSDIIVQLTNPATNATRLEIFIPGNWLKK